jgi:hypothetical protein
MQSSHASGLSINVEIEISVIEVALHSFENDGKDHEADRRD